MWKSHDRNQFSKKLTSENFKLLLETHICKILENLYPSIAVFSIYVDAIEVEMETGKSAHM